MTEQDKRPFFSELKRMGLAFSRDDIDAPMASVYFDALAELDWRTVQIAMHDCVASMSWFPKPVDIRDAEFGVRAREEQERNQRLIAAAPVPSREMISEAQWQERWATLKAIVANVKMKPHGPLRGPCDCQDCQRERGNHATAR